MSRTLHVLCNDVAFCAFGKILPGSIYIGQYHFIGCIECFGKLFSQKFGSAVAMRLEHCHHSAIVYTLSRFKESPSERALFAGYLAKLGDDRALEALLDVAESDDVKYIDFIEIRSAIERLGSEAPVRDFSNDPTYKAVKRLQVNPYKGRMQ